MGYKKSPGGSWLATRHDCKDMPSVRVSTKKREPAVVKRVINDGETFAKAAPYIPVRHTCWPGVTFLFFSVLQQSFMLGDGLRPNSLLMKRPSLRPILSDHASAVRTILGGSDVSSLLQLSHPI